MIELFQKESKQMDSEILKKVILKDAQRYLVLALSCLIASIGTSIFAVFVIVSTVMSTNSVVDYVSAIFVLVSAYMFMSSAKELSIVYKARKRQLKHYNTGA